MDEIKQKQIELITSLMETDYVSAANFLEALNSLVQKIDDASSLSESNLKSTNQRVIEIIRENVAKVNEKISKTNESTSKGQKVLTEAISALKKDIKSSLKDLKAEISDDIEEASDTSKLELAILKIQEDLNKPVVIETGLTIKNKLLALSKKDRLKLEELGGYEELIKAIEKYGLSRKTTYLPQSGITTTFFALNGADKGRAKNINFTSGTTLGVTLSGDTATITIPGVGGGLYTPQGVTSSTVGGLTSGTDLGVDPVTIQSIIDTMLYPYRAPTTTLSTTPSAGLYEKGNTQASVALSSTTTKRTNPITSFVFKKDGTTIYTSGAPNPTGGTENYTDATGVSTTTVYSAVVGDGTSTGTATATFTFVSSYYYGVGAVGLNVATDGGGLTKVLQGNTTSYATVNNPSNQVYYFLYPSSYPALTSILDTNGFEILPDYTVTTGVSITNSFGNITTYRKYEFNNLTSQTAFTITYIQ